MPDRDTTVKMEYKEPDESLYSSAEMSIVAGLKRENKRLMEQIYHTQGQMADVVRVVLPFTGYDSCDATYPYIQDFYIPTNTIELISVRVYYKIRAFRAYSKATQSNAQQTSSSGGGQTTSSGGGKEYTTPSGGGKTSGDGGSFSKTSEASSLVLNVVSFISVDGSGHVTSVGHGDVSHPSHTHTVSVSSHTHSCPNHQHTVTIDSHEHTVDSHTHTIDGHTHDITFGIYEKTPSSPSIKVWLSQNGVDFPLFIGESSDDYDFEFATQIKGTGWKSIKFEVNELMQIVSNIIVVADIKVTN